MRRNKGALFFILIYSLILINFSQPVQAWEGAVTIDSFKLHDSEVYQGDKMSATVTITNHDFEKHNIHFRGLLVDSDGEYYRGEDGSNELVFVDMDCCLSLYNLFEGETVTLELKINTFNLPLGTWTSDIGVLLYDNDDEVTDVTTTSQFKINSEADSIDGPGPTTMEGALAMCFGFIIMASLVGFIAIKHFANQDSNINPPVMMATSNQAIIASSVPPPPVPPKVNINPIPIPYTSLPPNGEYKQVGNVTIYSTIDGRTWIQQPNGTFIQN